MDIDRIIKQQRENDKSRRKMAEEIIDALKIKTADHGVRVAIGWCEQAAQYADNADYWEKRAKKAEAALAKLAKKAKQ